MKQAIARDIDRIASTVNGLKCGRERCGFAEDSDPKEMGWPHAPSSRWCGSCTAYWHLCEALRATDRDDFSTGSNYEEKKVPTKPKCRYDDCPGALDEGNQLTTDDGQVTCAICREYMGLPVLDGKHSRVERI